MQDSSKKPVTLVLGGVRSGKSRYAQTLVTRMAGEDGAVTFIATARKSPDDLEMTTRISSHVANRPAKWLSVEEPLGLAAAVLEACERSDVVMVDCLTLYASNLLEQAAEMGLGAEDSVTQLCAVLAGVTCPVVLVSNEVGSGVVPAYESGRKFRDLAGELNQRVAAVADTVVYMVAGLPMFLKGGPA